MAIHLIPEGKIIQTTEARACSSSENTQSLRLAMAYLSTGTSK